MMARSSSSRRRLAIQRSIEQFATGVRDDVFAPRIPSVWKIERVEPGEEAAARIHRLAPEYWDRVWPGTRIFAHEGARRIGDAVVIARTPELSRP